MDPTVASLISTNHPPTYAEAQYVHSLLLEGEDQLAELDKGILNAVRLLVSLTTKRQQHSASLLPLKAVLSPLRRCPPEILAEIFLCCRDNSMQSTFYGTMDPRDPPLLLGHICSSWRSISHNTPRLWEFLHFSNVQSSRLAAYACELGAKSRNLPIYMKLSGTHYYNDYHSHSPFDIIRSFSQTVQELRVFLLSDLCPEECTRPPLHAEAIFPILSSLVIKFGHWAQSFPSDCVSILDIFGGCPRLRHLGLNTMSSSNGLVLESRMPWRQLTSLDLGMSIEIIPARNLLARCGELRTCILAEVVGSDNAEDEPPLPICVLKNLSSLTMSINYADWVFFQPFVFPDLKSFDLLSERSLGDFLLDLQGRSAFSFTRLELSELDMDVDGLIVFLSVVPSLTELSLKQCACIEERLFAAFTHDSSSTDVVLPFLTSLTMEGREEVSREAVADMVQSLFWTANLGDGSFPLLKCIRLELTYPQYPDTPDILLKNIAATGFLVDLHEKSLV